MKRVSVLTALIGAATLSFSASALADAKSEISKVYDLRLKLFKARDAKGLAKMFNDLATEDISMDGAGMSGMKKKQLTQSIEAQMGMIKSVKGGSMTLGKWKIQGNTATLEVTEKMEFTMSNPQDAKKPMVMKGTTISSDTWVKVGNKWKLKKVKVLKEDYTVNGKKLGAS